MGVGVGVASDIVLRVCVSDYCCTSHQYKSLGTYSHIVWHPPTPTPGREFVFRGAAGSQ